MHLKYGARIIDFAGWLMPVQYESIIKEHEMVRKKAGLFDISHMGEFLLNGKGAFDFLQSIMTNDLRLLEVGKSQYSVMCYDDGTVVDDTIYYMESNKRFRMIVNASNKIKDFQWISDHINDYDLSISDISKERCRLAFQGPKSIELLNSLIDRNLTALKRFYFMECNLDKIPIFIARTGYTGEDGVELSSDARQAEKIWETILQTGAQPVGLGARDTLRLEACYSLYGHEISETITPIEANIGWVVKEKNGIDFSGKKALLNQKKKGPSRILVGLNLLDRGIIRENCKLFKENEKIGYVTSGGYSPTLKKTIGLALVRKDLSSIGTELEIEIREKLLRCNVVPTPFYRNV